jgi:ABC-type Mn2+/Zn2+ transport system ATPase subunit
MTGPPSYPDTGNTSQAAGPPMIEAKGLTKHYGATVAVDDLSFTVPPGQVTGFLGPNGAGKSTTMRLILGLPRWPPYRGAACCSPPRPWSSPPPWR